MIVSHRGLGPPLHTRRRQGLIELWAAATRSEPAAIVSPCRSRTWPPFDPGPGKPSSSDSDRRRHASPAPILLPLPNRLRLAAMVDEVQLKLYDDHVDLVTPEFEIRFMSLRAFRRFREWVETARVVGDEPSVRLKRSSRMTVATSGTRWPHRKAPLRYITSQTAMWMSRSLSLLIVGER